MEKNNKSSEEFFVRLTTGGRVNAIEDWLNEHAQGNWTIKVDGLSDDLMKKNYVIIFEREEDRNRFRTYYRLPKPRGRVRFITTRERVSRQVGTWAGQGRSSPRSRPRSKSRPFSNKTKPDSAGSAHPIPVGFSSLQPRRALVLPELSGWPADRNIVCTIERHSAMGRSRKMTGQDIP